MTVSCPVIPILETNDSHCSQSSTWLIWAMIQKGSYLTQLHVQGSRLLFSDADQYQNSVYQSK